MIPGFDRSGDKRQGSAVAGAAQRRHRRWYVDFETTLTLEGAAWACSVYDLSPGGACVEVPHREQIPAGSHVEFQLPGYGAIPADVRYIDGNYLGLVFRHDANDEIAVGRYLAAIELSRRPERREAKSDVLLRSSGVEMPGVLFEISRSGARIAVEDARHIMPDQEVTLGLPDIGAVQAVVTRIDERELGLVFLQDLAHVPHTPAAEPGAETSSAT